MQPYKAKTHLILQDVNIFFTFTLQRKVNSPVQMKKTVFLMSFIMFVFFAKAQRNSYDQRLLSKFSKKELSEMQLTSPSIYAYWNFYVANAFQIMDLPAEKSSAHEIKGIIKIEDMNAINIFDLHFVPLIKDYQYFRIEGANKLLVIISEEQIKEKFSKSAK